MHSGIELELRLCTFDEQKREYVINSLAGSSGCLNFRVNKDVCSEKALQLINTLYIYSIQGNILLLLLSYANVFLNSDFRETVLKYLVLNPNE